MRVGQEGEIATQECSISQCILLLDNCTYNTMTGINHLELLIVYQAVVSVRYFSSSKICSTFLALHLFRIWGKTLGTSVGKN